MIVGFKDTLKLFAVTVIVCCAAFVCILFLNYNIDLVSVKDLIISPAGAAIYDAKISTGKVVSAVSGGCLILTSAVMLLFYIKNYIDTHGKELGILKALGYPNLKIAKHFAIFGLPVLIGSAVGILAAFAYMPAFYKMQDSGSYFPVVEIKFHPLLTFSLLFLPAFVFVALAVLYAFFKLKNPVLNLLYDRQKNNFKTGKTAAADIRFLKNLPRVTLKSKKTLAFFVAFSAFCFSAMVQMSMSMNELSSDSFAWMILTIGLILAFITLFLALSGVVKGNTKTIAMMKVIGYEDKVCSRAILGVYRPVSYLGFVVGTAYQYGLLKLMVTLVFSGIENMPEYNFDFKAFIVTLVAFIATYELFMFFYSLRIKKLSLKIIMAE